MLKSFVLALIGGWRALSLFLSLALIGFFASASAAADGRLRSSNPLPSPIGDMPWTGRSLEGSSESHLSGKQDRGDRIWIAPIADSPTAFFPSLKTNVFEAPRAASSLPSLEAFRRSVMNGRPDQLTGIWVEDVLSFRVQQGLTNHAPEPKDTLSIYNWAWKHGVVGLLIHDYRGGTQLYQLNPGVKIAAIFGNGGVEWYLSRGGTWSESRSGSSGGFAGPFRIWSCDGCDFDVSARELHDRHYAGLPHLAFQTCVTAEGRTGLVIIEAYLDRPLEPLRPEDDSLDRWERIYPVMPNLYQRWAD